MTVELIPLTGIPEIGEGDDVAAAVLAAAGAAGVAWQDGDVLVVTHKIVSKAEGRVVPVTDDAGYRRLAEEEAVAVVRRRGDLVIAQTRHGYICANAGVDRSNAVPGTAVLLPLDPDRSAHRIRMRILRDTGVDVPVIISDTFGRPWRRGLTDVAIGISGMAAVLDLKGTTDATGRELHVTEIAVADEIAAAADLVMGKAAAIPAAVVRGVTWPAGSGRATDLVRPAAEDLFR
jgi:coenzyme F420-0:L-glutamate ligase / coenzyme F420-1:gamma-L-glutamate ligase